MRGNTEYQTPTRWQRFAGFFTKKMKFTDEHNYYVEGLKNVKLVFDNVNEVRGKNLENVNLVVHSALDVNLYGIKGDSRIDIKYAENVRADMITADVDIEEVSGDVHVESQSSLRKDGVEGNMFIGDVRGYVDLDAVGNVDLYQIWGNINIVGAHAVGIDTVRGSVVGNTIREFELEYGHEGIIYLSKMYGPVTIAKVCGRIQIEDVDGFNNPIKISGALSPAIYVKDAWGMIEFDGECHVESLGLGENVGPLTISDTCHVDELEMNDRRTSFKYMNAPEGFYDDHKLGNIGKSEISEDIGLPDRFEDRLTNAKEHYKRAFVSSERTQLIIKRQDISENTDMSFADLF